MQDEQHTGTPTGGLIDLDLDLEELYSVRTDEATPEELVDRSSYYRKAFPLSG